MRWTLLTLLMVACTAQPVPAQEPTATWTEDATEALGRLPFFFFVVLYTI